MTILLAVITSVRILGIVDRYSILSYIVNLSILCILISASGTAVSIQLFRRRICSLVSLSTQPVNATLRWQLLTDRYARLLSLSIGIGLLYRYSSSTALCPWYYSTSRYISTMSISSISTLYSLRAAISS